MTLPHQVTVEIPNNTPVENYKLRHDEINAIKFDENHDGACDDSYSEHPISKSNISHKNVALKQKCTTHYAPVVM